MSEKNREGKQSARERLAQERARHDKQDRRQRALIVGASIVAALGVAGGIGFAVKHAERSAGAAGAQAGPVVAPSGAAGAGALAVPVGKAGAKSTLTVWEDFRCPACKSFETSYRATVNELVGKGDLKVEYHLVTLIDNNAGGHGSLRAANAAACAQDAGMYRQFHDVLFENQPPEMDDQYAKNGRLIELAGKVPGLDTTAFRTCVEDGTHDTWVAKSYESFAKAKLRGTPSVLLNGEDIFGTSTAPLTPARLKAKVEKAAG